MYLANTHPHASQQREDEIDGVRWHAARAPPTRSACSAPQEAHIAHLDAFSMPVISATRSVKSPINVIGTSRGKKMENKMLDAACDTTCSRVENKAKHMR